MSETELPLLARQPILDHNLQIIGYELLCRPIPEDTRDWQENNGDYATSEVVISAYHELDIDKVTGGLPAFINFTRNWLFNPPIISENLLVAEVLEYIEAEPDVIGALQELRRLKYQIALDDYIDDPNQQKLLPYADIVKVDILNFPDLSRLDNLIKQHQRPGLTWLAEKVETPEEFEVCRNAGCTLFQGYFFAKPANVYGRRIPDNKVSVLQLLQLLNDPNAEIEDIARILKTEPQLSFRLLQMINSPATGCVAQVTSIQQAIMMAGLQRIKKWAQVLALGKLSDKPLVLREQAVLRGFLTQELSTFTHHLDPNSAFTLGLFSLLDAFLDIPMQEICERLKLPQEMKAALLNQQGDYGHILKLVNQIEYAEWQKAHWITLAKQGIRAPDVVAAYHSALLLSHELFITKKAI